MFYLLLFALPECCVVVFNLEEALTWAWKMNFEKNINSKYQNINIYHMKMHLNSLLHVDVVLCPLMQ